MSDSDSISSNEEDPKMTSLVSDISNQASLFIPLDLPVKDGMINVPSRGLASMVSEISLGVDAHDIGEEDSDEEELAPKKGMHNRGGLLNMLPLEEELSLSDEDSDEDSDDDSDDTGGIGKESLDQYEKVRGKPVMQVVDQIVNDHYGDSGLYTGSVTVEALVPHGKGILLYENSRIYDGEWEDGKWHGLGNWTNTNGDIYVGEFVYEKREGKGTYTWPNGNEYTGEFKDDNRHGKGKFKFSNGSLYEGDFQDGQFEGKGTYSFGTGMYEGEWKMGKYHGHGFLLNADGSSYTGNFDGGVQHGNGSETRTDGSVVSGYWTRGRPPVQW